MQDIVKFLFGISGESIAASSILGCWLGVGPVNLHVFGWFACFRKCHCSLSLLIPGAYLLEDHQEEINRGLLRGAVQHDTPELPPLSLVRSAVRVPEQHPGVNDQRRRVGDRDRVRGDLPGVRVEPEDAAPDAGPGVGSGGGVHGGGAGVAAGAARAGPEALLRPRRHHLLHLHVRLAALHHEAGGEDEERGVHAVPAVSGSVPVRHVVVRLRPARTRPIRHDPQRVRELPGRRAARSLRHLPEQRQGRRRPGRQAGAGPSRRGDARAQEHHEGRQLTLVREKNSSPAVVCSPS